MSVLICTLKLILGIAGEKKTTMKKWSKIGMHNAWMAPSLFLC